MYFEIPMEKVSERTGGEEAVEASPN